MRRQVIPGLKCIKCDYLEISASASAMTSALQKNFFFLRSFYFYFSKFLMKKTSMVKSFSSTLVHLPGNFSRCLEQLFCRKPVSNCFWRQELHSRRNLRSFKNTHGWKLHFALEITSWKFSVSFKALLRSLGVRFQKHTNSTKSVLQLWGNFSKFLGELLFGTYHTRVRFLDRTQKFLLLYLNVIQPQTLSNQFQNSRNK